MRQTSVKGSLEAILLSVIAERDAIYGLEVVREVAERTQGDIQLNAGSLYPGLRRLETRGCLTAAKQSPPQGGAPVSYYSVTDEGRKVLTEEREKARAYVRHLEELLRL